MNNVLDKVMRKSINIMIENSSNEKTLKRFTKKHESKIHFVPIKYRIFGGMIQSLNIKFGNFIEEAIHQILVANPDIEILENYSGKRSNDFCISDDTEKLIDQYISNCEANTYSDIELMQQYNKLLDQIMINESNDKAKISKFKHDVDILFKDKKEDIIYYVEIKYNDDHDTGKFVDINRKLLKTYAYLIRELKIYDKSKFKPMLFYFTNKRMKGNIYIPENECIYRGTRFFNKFTTVRYDELENYMLNISEEELTIQQFDNMYNKIVKDKIYQYNKDVTIYSINEDKNDEYKV